MNALHDGTRWVARQWWFWAVPAVIGVSNPVGLAMLVTAAILIWCGLWACGLVVWLLRKAIIAAVEYRPPPPPGPPPPPPPPPPPTISDQIREAVEQGETQAEAIDATPLDDRLKANLKKRIRGRVRHPVRKIIGDDLWG